MRPADDALVILLQAAESRLDLVAFAQFVLLRASVTVASRVEALDVLLLEPLVGISIVVPTVVIISKWEPSRRSELDFFHAERLPHVHSTIGVDLDDLSRI